MKHYLIGMTFSLVGRFGFGRGVFVVMLMVFIAMRGMVVAGGEGRNEEGGAQIPEIIHVWIKILIDYARICCFEAKI